MYEKRTNGNLKSARLAKFKEGSKRMSVVAKRLALLLLLGVFAVGGSGSVHGEEKAKPELEIKKVSSKGTGGIKIPVPGMSNTVYVIGSSREKVFTVKVKNNTKKEKRGVKVKLSAYDKKRS